MEYAVTVKNQKYNEVVENILQIKSTNRVKRTFAIRFRYLLMNAVALRPVSGSL